jgi:hypothetical protein
MQVQLFSEPGKCGAGDHDARFVLVRDGEEERLCPEHLRQKLVQDHELLSSVLVDLLTAEARPRAGQTYPRG